MAAAHSRLGASSAKRWMTCPGSFTLAENVEKPGASVYAAAGTVAHELAEWSLLKNKPPTERLGEFVWCQGHEITVDADMCRAVQVYLDAISARIEWGVEVHHETRVSLRGWWPANSPPPVDLFGTADTWMWNPATGRLTIVDFKFGSGVYVTVIDNPQLLYYAAGVLLLLPRAAVREVEIVVVQPRARGQEPVRSWTIDALDLRLWIDFTLRPAVGRVADPDADLVPGTHCRFCNAKPTCPARADMAQAAARADFPDTIGD